MMYNKYILILFPLVFYGCLLFNNKNGMGVQYFSNVSISMENVYNVLKNNFLDFDIELKEIAESSSYMLSPKRGNVIVKFHHIILMRSEKYSIIIQYSIDSINRINSYATFTGFYINYYLLGDNIYERIDELKIPMNDIRQCLLKNFPDLLNETNFTEVFKPIPYR